MLLRLPLAIYNTGARAIVVRGLRCWFPEVVTKQVMPLLSNTTLTEDEVRAVLASPYRFVPTTANDRLTGFADREAVALTVARAFTAAG